jgi:hypothetical protein
MMIGCRKPVSDDDEMRSETVRPGRDSESDKVSVLWKARWMVVLVEMAGRTSDPALCCRLLQDTRHKRNCWRRRLRTATDTRYFHSQSRLLSLKLERRKTLVVPLFQALSY